MQRQKWSFGLTPHPPTNKNIMSCIGFFFFGINLLRACSFEFAQQASPLGAMSSCLAHFLVSPCLCHSQVLHGRHSAVFIMISEMFGLEGPEGFSLKDNLLNHQFQQVCTCVLVDVALVGDEFYFQTLSNTDVYASLNSKLCNRAS